MAVEPTGGGEPAFRLAPANSVYIMIPADGQYGGTRYYGSGLEVANTLSTEFARHTNALSSAVKVESLDAAMDHCRERHIDYVLLPQIVHWEDRAALWSVKVDHISVRITIYSVENGDTKKSSLISADSRWFTFVDHAPGVLFKKPIKQYVSQLYQ